MAHNNAIPTKSELNKQLQCSICDNRLKDPHTLQCLHSFCKSCINAIPMMAHEGGSTGWYCPLCKNFTEKDSLKENNFIINLLEVIDAQNTEGKVGQVTFCSHCQEHAQGNWQCINCKMVLCNKCQGIPNLKCHNIVPIGKDDEFVVDRPTLCVKHNEQIKYNCKTCEEPICIECKVTQHDVHPSETVEIALNRILPEMEQHSRTLKTNQEGINNKIKALTRTIDHTFDKFLICKTRLRTQRKKLLQHIRTLADEMDTKITEEETNAQEKLQEIKQDMRNELNDITNLINLFSLTTKNARYTSLLTQVQDGLYQRLKDKSKAKQEPINMNITDASFEVPVNVEATLPDAESLLGKLTVSTRPTVISPETAVENNTKSAE